MPTFKATNPTTDPITAYFSVIPYFISGDVTCPGDPYDFSITITPHVILNAVEQEMIYCNKIAAPEYIFSSNLSEDVEYQWEKVSGDNIGLSPIYGKNTLPEFLTENNTNDILSATYRVTPVYTGLGKECAGDTTEFMITVLPTAQVNFVENKIFCRNTNTPVIVFSGNTALENTTYRWEQIGGADIGSPNSGENDMPIFTTKNDGNILYSY